MCIVLSVDINHCYEYLQSAMFCWSRYTAVCSFDCSNKTICKPLEPPACISRVLSITCVCVCVCVCVCLVTQSCPTLCDPLDHNPPGYSLHGIFQSRIL